MPEIKAFKGWRYNPQKVKNIKSVLAPPYDVISKEGQANLYKNNPFNVIRLILGKEKSSDTAASNRYTRAQKHLSQWTSQKVLVQENNPAIYIYLQNYKEKGKSKSRLGFITAMKLDESAVLRHEDTLAKPKKDRMALLKKTRANLSPLFGLFEDENKQVRSLLQESIKQKPTIDVQVEGVRHRFFVESRPDRVQRICAKMRKKEMYIADGHHRFDVTCQFKKWMQSQSPRVKDPSWSYAMTYFADYTHNPFTIDPTHRLIRFSKSTARALSDLGEKGELTKVSNLNALLKKLLAARVSRGPRTYAFGAYTKKEGYFVLILSREIAAKIKKNPADQLDVATLHHQIIEPCFGIKSVGKSDAIAFEREPKISVEKVNKGEFDMALFLNEASLDEMILVSKKGLKMPQKSTYFYPKLLSGLVFHRFENGAS